MNGPLYELKDITQVYSRRTVLDVPHLRIEPGAILGITGPNGCGKSTLMRLLAFVEAPASGVVRFKGRQTSLKDSLVRRQVSMLGQIPYLLKRSVMSNVAFGLKVRGVDEIAPRVHRGLEMVGLDPARFATRSWDELSGGEAQRVALAARLVLEPEVLLLDEPTASLDRESAEMVKSAALQAKARWQTTLIVVSHDLEWLAAIAERTLSLRDGRVVDRTLHPVRLAQ
jgi:tungstate transport system ATP-binding protein